MPTAESLPDGGARLFTTPTWHRDCVSPSVGGQSCAGVATGFLPRLELALTLGDWSQGYDAALHAKVQARREQNGWPALSVGVLDLHREGASATAFVAATKRLAGGRLALSLGGAQGGTAGIFGGASYQVGSVLRLMGEYDTRRLNYGAALFPARQIFLRAAQCDVGTLYTGGVQFDLNWPSQRPPAAAPAAGAALSPSDAAESVRQDLVALGFEDVRVAAGDGRLTAAFDNRVYTLNDRDAVAAALPVLGEHAPAGTRELCVRLQHRGIAVMEAQVPADACRDYAAGRIGRDAFTRRIRTRLAPAGGIAGAAANPSVLHADLMLGVGLDTEIASERYFFGTGWHARPEVSLPLGRGLLANARWSYPVGGVLAAGQPRRFSTDRMVAGWAVQPASGILAQAVGGRFPGGYVGAGLEVAAPAGRYGLIRGIWGSFDDTAGNRHAGCALGEYWHSLPAWDARVRLYGGRFLKGDDGAGVDLLRDFGEVEVGVGMASTSRGRALLTRLVLPLGPRRQTARPGALRVRPADIMDYRQRSSLAQAGFNDYRVPAATANELNLGGVGLIESMLNRARW